MSHTVGGRFPPAMPAAAYKTFQIAAPLATHWNVVTCADAECQAHEFGWRTVIDEGTSLGQRQAHYIRKESGRKYTEERQPDGLTAFSFDAGQKCFAQHKGRNMRPERFVERDGDHRGNPTRRRREFARPDEWVDSFATHQDRLRTIVERG
jgi:hypothetical protein